MKAWSREWLDDTRSSVPGSENCFAEIWDAIERYYRSSNRTVDPAIQPQVNFEKALGDMLALAHWMTPAPYGTTLRQITCNNAAPPDLSFPYDSYAEPYGPPILINTELSYLLGRLAKHLRAICADFNEMGDDHFRSYKTFLDVLRAKFDVGVYNLNYDNITLRAWPDAFTGFGSDGVFDSMAVCGRVDWGFIYHLHGSVHHTLANEFSQTIRWQTDLKSVFFDDHAGRWTVTGSDGRPFPICTLVAGGFKLDQLLIEPFQSFYSAFIGHVHEADAILIAGYGFSDAHVNRTLQRRLRDAAERNLPRPPVAVIDRYDEKRPGLIRRDLWTQSMRDALATSDGALETGRAPISEEHKIAMWLDGMLEAAGSPDAVVSWLDNPGADALRGALQVSRDLG
jgi:hypothetical protein